MSLEILRKESRKLYAIGSFLVASSVKYRLVLGKGSVLKAISSAVHTNDIGSSNSNNTADVSDEFRGCGLPKCKSKITSQVFLKRSGGKNTRLSVSKLTHSTNKIFRDGGIYDHKGVLRGLSGRHLRYSQLQSKSCHTLVKAHSLVLRSSKVHL